MDNNTFNGTSTVTDTIAQKLKSLVMHAPAATALLEGPDHIYTLANSAYQKLYGRTESQLIGRSLKEVFPEVESQGIHEIFQRVYQTGEPFTAQEFPAKFEYGGNTREGYYNFSIQPIKDELGQVSDLMVHAYEVTRQVEAYRRAEENEEKYKSLFNNMDYGWSLIEVMFNKYLQPVDYCFLEVNHVFVLHTGL
jgi:PAS domain S-box-containing protein